MDEGQIRARRMEWVQWLGIPPPDGGAGGIGGAIISDTEPAGAPVGAFWFDWATPALRLRFDFQTWVELLPTFTPPPGPPAEPTIPTITSALTYTLAPGAAFDYHITATGGPTSFNATPLPSGFAINTETGALTGTAPTTEGALPNITISATNALGTGSATLRLTVVGTPTPTPPWEITYVFPNRVTFQNDATGRIPLTSWTGWDPSFAQDINDQALYLGPNAPATPADQVVRMFAIFTAQPEVEVDFDKFGGRPGGPAANTITQWGYDSGSNSFYIDGSNSTGNPIQLRIAKT
ncbi:MAG: hypothetical protein J2P48_08280 [Alphaproteobacteria bacterium]|nr:hypothetical protein [Alphaproteobacteria bacterium]